MIVGIVLAAAALVGYDKLKIDPDVFALDPTIELSEETWNEVPFTALFIGGLRNMVAKQQAQPPTGDARCKPTYLAWLGNSQLHYIHRYQKGDHTAPYWLRETLDCRDATVPLGVSLAGANLQEHYVLAQYLERRLPIRAIILELSFDDLRGDGLRDDFSILLDDKDRVATESSPVGAWILSKAEEAWKGRNSAERNSGLEGFAQKSLEDALDGFLSRHWRMWADRKYLQATLTVELYDLRNLAFGIKPTTLRRMIPARYERNMAALTGLLQEAQGQNIPVLCYIMPTRHDIASPFDPTAYANWKSELEATARTHGAVLLDLEGLIPASEWGASSTDADLTHFTGRAHTLLAAAVLPHVLTLLRTGRFDGAPVR
jgi:hypothetical protein